MNEELMITKDDLVNWLNRPPSNDDLDLIGFITTRLENFYKLQQENKQLKEDYITTCEEKNKYISTLEQGLNSAEQKVEQLNCVIDKAIEYINIETQGCDEELIEGSWLYDLYAIRDILGDKE